MESLQLLFDFSTFSGVCAHLVPASWLYICAHSLEMKLFLVHNVNTLIILTKHPATQEITEIWKVSSNFVCYTLQIPRRITSFPHSPSLCNDVCLKNSISGAGGVLVLRSVMLQQDGYLLSRGFKPNLQSQTCTPPAKR